MDYHAMTMTGHDFPENVNVIGLISNGFDDLGVPPLLGRGLVRSDAIDGQDPQPVAVVSYKFWQERLAADPQAVGKTLQLDRKNYTIVGVAAPRFKWYNADVYLPLKMTQDPAHLCIVDFRLRPGVTHQAADAALQPLLDQFARDMPKQFPEHFKVQVEGLNEWVQSSMGGTLYLLLGAVALLLAIGCGNVSILLLAHDPGGRPDDGHGALVHRGGRDARCRRRSSASSAAPRRRPECARGSTTAVSTARPSTTRRWRTSSSRPRSRLLGAENVETETRTLGGEDMSVFLDRVPGCFFFVGSAPDGEHRPHHSPRFDFDERALAIGTRALRGRALAAGKNLVLVFRADG